MYQKKISQEEEKFFKCLERLDNSYEMLSAVFKDLGLKEKRWDILRMIKYIKWDIPKSENKYYLIFEPYIEKVLLMSGNEIRSYYLKFSNLQDDFKEDEKDFQYLEKIKKELIPLNFSEKQCKLISYREQCIIEKYENRLSKTSKDYQSLIRKNEKELNKININLDSEFTKNNSNKIISKLNNDRLNEIIKLFNNNKQIFFNDKVHYILSIEFKKTNLYFSEVALDVTTNKLYWLNNG